MKKLVLMMVGLFLIGSSAIAQDKEALKAQKEAQKEAEKTLKKAHSTYELSIPNPTVGRKETDFEKMGTALPLIQSAMQNEFTKNNVQTWKVAADIYAEYYKKYDAELKADPDNEELKGKIYETGINLLDYSIKYDSLMLLDPKMKEEERTAQHKQYQAYGWWGAVLLLQECQKYAYSEEPAELKKTVTASNHFLYATEKTNLMKDVAIKDLDNYKTLSKVFRAQAKYNLPGVPADEIAQSYQELFNTSYKAWAYQSLTNYYHQKEDTVNWEKMLVVTIDELANDESDVAKQVRPAFIAQYLQYNFQKKNLANVDKYGQMLINQYPDNDRTFLAYSFKGELLRQDNKFDEAEKIFLEGAEKYPSESQCMRMACTAAFQKAQANGFKQADMDHAIALLTKAEEQYPDEPEIWGQFLYVLYNNAQKPALRDKYKKYNSL